MVAFDDVVVNTVVLRAEALMHAMAHFNVPVLHPSGTQHAAPHDASHDASHDDLNGLLRRLLRGRTFAEAVRLVPTERASDETLVDLLVLDASRRYTQALAQGVTIEPNIIAWLERALMASTRVVARADSAREQVNGILAMSGLGALFSSVHCSDDAPGATGMDAVQSGWQRIDQRLSSASIPRERRFALEPAEHAARAAVPFVASVHASTFNL